MDTRVASRYAQSLFDVASKANIVPSVSDDLSAISAALKSDPRFQNFMDSPAFTREAKLSLLEGVFGDRVTALTMQLVRLLLEKRREGLIAEVASEFEVLRRAASNTLFAQIISSVPLEAGQKTAVVAKLEKSSGQKVEATYEIDPSILGGIKVQLGNYVLDGSVKGTLNRLSDRLLYDVLKQI